MSPYKNTNDEMFGMFFKKKVPREHCKSYWSWFLKQSPVDLRSANAEASVAIYPKEVKQAFLL